MKIISLLKLEKGQKLPRPFSRISSRQELSEILLHWLAMNTGPDKGRWSRAQAAANNASPSLFTGFKNIDTETPVFEHGSTKFYAFIEQ